ncbi:MAG: uroporphyrinogen decarboxylase, partial [Hyphomicrobiales bacterium]
MRQAGRYLPEYREIRSRAGGFLELCYTPELACEVTLQPIRRFGFDAAILFSDILVVPDALGQKVAFQEGEGPVLEALADGRAIAALTPDSALEHLTPVFEAVERIRAKLPKQTDLIGFCGAPWTVATYMIGGRGSADQAAARLFAYRHRQDFARLMEMLVEVSSRYLLRQVRAGAQALQIFDSWAGTLPEDEFARWCVEPVREIVAKVKAQAPRVPVIAFPRGAGPRYEGYAGATGADAVACDTSLPLTFIRDRL